jgi:hypothetical protein
MHTVTTRDAAPHQLVDEMLIDEDVDVERVALRIHHVDQGTLSHVDQQEELWCLTAPRLKLARPRRPTRKVEGVVDYQQDLVEDASDLQAVLCIKG